MTAVLALTVILAVFAALIWFLWQQRQSDVENRPGQEDARISPLLRGINYLLSDEPDQALKELVHVARLQTETAEVYLALGDLFRNKGEFGRAVRIHQNLLARPGLPEELYMEAQFALAMDFQAGGLLGRALKQYRKVLDVQPGHIPALEATLRIREQSQEWSLAEDVLSRLDQVRGTSSSLHHAYLMTEMARGKLGEGDEEHALNLVTKAIDTNPACAAAHMLLAEIDLNRGDHDAAFASMKSLQQAAPQYISLLIPLLLEHPEIYTGQGEAFLLTCWEKHHDEFMALEWIKGVSTKHGIEEAKRLMAKTSFSPEGLRTCLHLKAMMGDDDALALASRNWQQQSRNFTCGHCGVEVMDMRWQCPQCHEWGSMRPIQEVQI
ncbi:MAG: lipopolysaccharide assembly protein LapB [Zetaproteobacteria bacterium]|nr:MAG: lipopolysaccharide assembly protein LapB [Zetaproteobacteria bacterium]